MENNDKVINFEDIKAVTEEEPKEEVPVEESTDTYTAPEEEGKMTNIPPEEWTEPAAEAETTNEGNYMLEGISDDFESDGSGD